MKFDIIGRRYLWFALSALIIIPGLISMVLRGFNLGIDFTGGTLLDLQFVRPVTVVEVRTVLDDYKLGNSTIQLASTSQTEAAQNVFIRTRVLDDDERRVVIEDMHKRLGDFEVQRVEKVGAVIGSELTWQAIKAVLLAAFFMVLYLTYRFEFRFAVSGILAIFHDVLVVLGVFSLLQKEIDSSFVAAILTIVGYSITDTVVIFDRIRENLKMQRKNESLQELVNHSIWQTMTRSLYTILTVLFATASLYFFGGETTKNFSFALLVGFISGVYSSIFNASPIWVTWKEYADRKRLAGRAKAK
ncbi:protein translocase subunit SecF [Propionispora vibrioides]|uniref:Protein-export membrane protein SecF n=1 Tax=Propionispora vibrioides TaxID=112903 RepID=A0A1H8NWN6_9FIRM|nr:protein translocase subunit SecF [Propionispora vibrioides]SEO34075.1 preprotein translocase subunit SecF [Propionispora vibrioides]